MKIKMICNTYIERCGRHLVVRVNEARRTLVRHITFDKVTAAEEKLIEIGREAEKLGKKVIVEAIDAIAIMDYNYIKKLNLKTKKQVVSKTKAATG